MPVLVRSLQLAPCSGTTSYLPRSSFGCITIERAGPLAPLAVPASSAMGSRELLIVSKDAREVTEERVKWLAGHQPCPPNPPGLTFGAVLSKALAAILTRSDFSSHEVAFEFWKPRESVHDSWVLSFAFGGQLRRSSAKSVPVQQRSSRRLGAGPILTASTTIPDDSDSEGQLRLCESTGVRDRLGRAIRGSRIAAPVLRLAAEIEAITTPSYNEAIGS